MICDDKSMGIGPEIFPAHLHEAMDAATELAKEVQHW